jgi:hypothetical protein
MIPLVCYVLSAGYFLFAGLGNIMREQKIKLLLSEASSLTNMPMGGDAAISDTELAELEAMVDDVLESKNSKSTAKKRATRKTKTTKTK